MAHDANGWIHKPTGLGEVADILGDSEACNLRGACLSKKINPASLIRPWRSLNMECPVTALRNLTFVEGEVVGGSTGVAQYNYELMHFGYRAPYVNQPSETIGICDVSWVHADPPARNDKTWYGLTMFDGYRHGAKYTAPISTNGNRIEAGARFLANVQTGAATSSPVSASGIDNNGGNVTFPNVVDSSKYDSYAYGCSIFAQRQGVADPDHWEHVCSLGGDDAHKLNAGATMRNPLESAQNIRAEEWTKYRIVPWVCHILSGGPKRYITMKYGAKVAAYFEKETGAMPRVVCTLAITTNAQGRIVVTLTCENQTEEETGFDSTLLPKVRLRLWASSNGTESERELSLITSYGDWKLPAKTTRQFSVTTSASESTYQYAEATLSQGAIGGEQIQTAKAIWGEPPTGMLNV